MSPLKDSYKMQWTFLILIAVLALALSYALTPLDAAITVIFMPLPPASILGVFTALFSALPVVLAGVTTVYCVAWLEGKNRVMVVMQLTSLAFLLQFYMLQQFKIAAAPLSTVLTIIAATSLGLLLQIERARDRQIQTSQLQIRLISEESNQNRLALVKQDEADRRILAADLHDQVLNDLKQVKVKINSLPASAQTEEISALVDQSTTQIRSVMENLTPSVLENLGLISALQDLLGQTAQKGNLRTRLDNAHALTLDLDSVQELLVYRIVQEVLNNTVKHAQARHVTLKIEMLDEVTVFAITDDGIGIDSDKERAASRGLRYIRQRADILGAIASWHSGKDNHGTTFKLQLPARKT